ncbi:hypothetical protein A2Z22_02495 [Candidatus Woesebacteria bacterium RBG_16_34_12]|uniref:HTH luxR-type domain-containing protein n=1 Tax=Candidatus Woesebacteria bacterium RBG_16_34_12 TaxID=1802480 RepID=A0A1F7XBM9_9BACT|nr:MAG: hypothetical protein A2Z22_02495 [Candidatus Woesebacteria bacterium RBG_16_34_12]
MSRQQQKDMEEVANIESIKAIESLAESLSKREKEVVRLMAEGFENRAIADKLFVSVKTVEFHKENIKQKFGIKKVKELYRLFRRLARK